MTRTAVVVCPGRGTYNKEELGYLHRNHADQRELLAGFDAIRAEAGQETVTALDSAEKFSIAKFTRGDNASALIYACSFSDSAGGRYRSRRGDRQFDGLVHCAGRGGSRVRD